MQQAFGRDGAGESVTILEKMITDTSKTLRPASGPNAPL